jgi:hypothetical protein
MNVLIGWAVLLNTRPLMCDLVSGLSVREKNEEWVQKRYGSHAHHKQTIAALQANKPLWLLFTHDCR